MTYELFRQAWRQGKLDRAAELACDALADEQSAVFDDGSELLELEFKAAADDGGRLAIEATVTGPRGDLRTLLELSTLYRAVEEGGAFPGLGLLSWALVEQFRSERTSSGGGDRRQRRAHSWRPHRIGNGKPPSLADLRLPSAYRVPEQVGVAAGFLVERESDVLLVGRPASGKTTSLVAVARQLKNRGHGLVLLDLTDPADGAESVLVTLLSAPMRQNYLVAVDNFQANIAAAREILPLVEWLRDRLGLSLRVLATGWPSVRQAQLHLPSSIMVVQASGIDIINVLLTDLDYEDGQKIRRLARSDLVLATNALEFYKRSGHAPSYDELVTAVAKKMRVDRIDDPETRRWLYWFACLGRFEIDINAEHCAEFVPRAVLTYLMNASLVQTNDESLSVGHRSLAVLLLHYARRQGPDWADQPLEPPSRLAFEYLQQAESRHVLAVLDRLDLAGLEGEGKASQLLAKEWRSLTALCENVKGSTFEDPSWGGDTAAAVNAALTLVQYPGRDEEFVEAWDLIAKWLHDQWSYDTPRQPPKQVEGRPTEPVFIGIEDAVPMSTDTAAAANRLALAHRMWVLGELLDFELTALAQDDTRIDKLAELATQLRRGGGYEPFEMPWITANIVIALCRNGRRLEHTGKTIREATGWLRTQVVAGRDEHGAAVWDARLPATAIFVIALLRAGPSGDMEHQYIDTAVTYLWERREAWNAAGREPDAALAIVALLEAGHHIDDLHPYVMRLLDWARKAHSGDSANVPTEPDALPRQRRALTRVAALMTTVVPKLVYPRLEKLLEAFDLGPAGGDPGTVPASPAPSGPSDPGSGQVQSGQVAAVNGAAQPAPAAAARVPVDDTVRQAATWVGQHISDNVVSRRNALSRLTTPSRVKYFQDELKVWQDRSARYDRIAAELTDTTTADTIRALDELGREALRHAWIPLQTGGE